jgi:cobalt-zinc-cadmium efflux system outer membrane protein
MLTTWCALALAAGPLSLGEVLASAEQSFPSMVAARADVEGADGERLGADGAFDPTWRTRGWGVPVSGYPQVRLDSVIEVPTPLWGASFFGGYRLGAGNIVDYYGERVTWTGGELRAGAVVPVVRNGPIDRRRVTLARAELGQRLAGLGVEQQRLELMRVATNRYWEWVAAGRRRELARELLQLAKDRDVQLTGRAKVGDVPEFEAQDNRRALVQREALLVQAQRGVEQAALELSLFVRVEGRSLLPTDEQLPTQLPEPEGAVESGGVEEALAQRPDVARLVTQRQQLQQELRFARNQLLPALDLGVTVSQDVGASPGAKYDSLGKTELELSAVLEVPLLLRAPRGRLQVAQAAVAKLDAQLGLARERVALEVRDAESALAAARGRISLARNEIALAITLERGERARFELGDSTLLFVNLREQATAEAKAREIDSLLDAQRAKAALRAALGVPLTASR